MAVRERLPFSSLSIERDGVATAVVGGIYLSRTLQI
jgi:hypothetical protein